MSIACRCIADIADELRRMICHRFPGGKIPTGDFIFFRGESRNFGAGNNSEIGTAFESSLDRNGLWKQERELFEEAMRLNVASFEHDKTMAERIARMQHYQLPTRFADISDNILLSSFFAAETKEHGEDVSKDDGFVRVIHVAGHKMKSFTSDIIIALSHLPLVDSGNIEPSKKNGIGYLTFEIKAERSGFYDHDSCPELNDILRRDLQQVWAFRPKVNNPRIANQGGAFLVFGCRDGKEPLHSTFSIDDFEDENAPSYGIEQIGAIRIAAQSKSELRDELRHFGMSEERVYPDLSNVCAALTNRAIQMEEKK